MKSIAFFAVAVLAAGCASAQGSDDIDEGAGAAVSGTRLSEVCPTLFPPLADLTSMRATVAPSRDVLVEQRFGSSSTLISPDVHYELTFTSAGGVDRFQLVIQPFGGIEHAIDGRHKELRVSGTIKLNADHTSGTFDVDSRRDVLEGVTGQTITGFPFSNFQCRADTHPKFTFVAPVVSLEPKGVPTATEGFGRPPESSDGHGPDVDVTEKVEWRLRSPSGSLEATPTFG
jgi:hypothetical protein